MNKQLSLENIFLAIRLNCPVDPEAEKPLLLYKQSGTVKHKGIGRMLFLYFAIKAGHDIESIQQHILMTGDELEGKIHKINKFITSGRLRFENDPNGPEDTSLFFYRKFLLVKSYLKYNHLFLVNDESFHY